MDSHVARKLRLEQIGQTNDRAAKRQIIELLVARIRVDPQGGRKDTRLTISYTSCLAGATNGTGETSTIARSKPLARRSKSA